MLSRCSIGVSGPSCSVNKSTISMSSTNLHQLNRPSHCRTNSLLFPPRLIVHQRQRRRRRRQLFRLQLPIVSLLFFLLILTKQITLIIFFCKETFSPVLTTSTSTIATTHRINGGTNYFSISIEFQKLIIKLVCLFLLAETTATIATTTPVPVINRSFILSN